MQKSQNNRATSRPTSTAGKTKGGSFQKFPKTLFGFYWTILKSHRWYAITTAVTGVVLNVLGIVIYPFTMSKIYSVFDYSGPDFWDYVGGVMLLVGVLYLGIIPLRMLRDAYASRMRPRISQEIRTILYDRLFASDYRFFLDKNTGYIQNQVSNIYNRFHSLTTGIVVQVLGIIVGLSIIFEMMGRVNMYVALIICGYGFFTLVWHLLSMRRRARLSSAASKVHSKLQGTLSDSILNFTTVKIFASADQEQGHIAKDKDDHLRASWSADRFRMLSEQLLAFAQDVARLGLIFFCIYLFYKGEMGVGGFALALAAWNRFEMQFIRFGNILTGATTDYAEAKQAWGEIMVPQSIGDKPGAKPLAVKRGAIELRDISFRYNPKKWVISNLSLKIKPGEKIGIVGLSGAGKTTLSHLLLRLFDVQHGGIFVDGQNIKNVQQNSLRRQIAFVPQDMSLFNRTLRQNIGYARPGATDKEIERAAKLADVHDFIMSTEKGYDTVVGGRGLKLSGGQKQRIAIARAILKNVPILILDEATSALDSETEATIQKSFDVLMKGRTTIAIAHRLSTLRKMDRIVVMDKGTVAEQGTHAALLKKNGIYARLWKMQSGGFIQG
ncbi:MAG: ABC transporter ATP-binding protein/permease [Alphaproteobacteria bacterium]|nr:ABC transporter ATP-binding protein/permease [Alphaproteobacteria bacterium]